MNKRAFLLGKMASNNGQVLTHGRVSQELLNEFVAVTLRFGEEHDPGRESIDTVHDKRALTLLPQIGGKQGPSGGRVGTFHGDGGKPGRLFECDDGIVFIKNSDFPAPRISPALSSSPMIPVRWTLLHAECQPSPWYQP